MTDVSGTIEKVATRRGLFALAERALSAEGWKVSRVPRGGKSSLRQITRGAETRKVSIRTSQDAWVAFPRKKDGSGWITLDDVDFLIAASVNDKHSPTEARVHMIPAEEARDRFDRAYAARTKAKHTLPAGRGMWVSLYDMDRENPVTHVGGGMGIDYPPIAVHDLKKSTLSSGEDVADDQDDDDHAHVSEPPLTIADAKRRLAESLGVPESAIRITIEH